MTVVALPISGPSRRWPMLGLRWRVALTSTVVGLAAFVAGAAFLNEEALEDRDALRQRAQAAALASTTSFEREVAAAGFLLMGLSKAPSLVSGEYRAFYDQLAATPRPEGTWFTLWNPDGQILNTLRPFGGPLPRRTDYRQFDDAWARVRDRGISVSSRAFSPVANTPIIAVATRIDGSDGRMKGVLSVNLPEARIAASLRDNPLPDGWVTTVFDRNRMPAASSGDGPEASVGMPTALQERLRSPEAPADGTVYDPASGTFFAYRASRTTDFVTATAVPAALIEAPVTEARRRITWAGLALLLAGGAVGLAVARQVGPIETSATESARKLRLAEARYASLWHDTSESLFIVTVAPDRRFVFEGLNPAHEQATGLSLEAIAGKEPWECLPPETAAAVTARYRTCLETGQPWIYDEVLDLPSGRRYWQTCLAPVRDPETGRIVTLVGTARDVTADREAREQVERSQRLLQATVDALAAHVAILDGTGTIIAVNRAWRSFGQANGYADPDHGIGIDYRESSRVAALGGARAAAVARGLTSLLDGDRHEFRSSYRGGDRFFQMTAARFTHDGGTYVVVAHEDVTELMAARQDARDTARRLLSLQEEERQRIAADLHDTTAQHLAAAGLALMQVSAVAGDPGAVAKALDPVWTSLDEAQREIRTLSFLLYPPGLRTHGLAASLRQLVGGFADRNGIAGEVAVSDEVDEVPFEVQRSILRVAQEALINVHRHAEASRVAVNLEIAGGALRLSVIDDGRGFNPAIPDGSGDAPRLGVGIPGMEARIRQFDGALEIVGGPAGTTINAVIPLVDGWSPPSLEPTEGTLNDLH